MMDDSVPQIDTPPATSLPAYRHLGSNLRFWIAGVGLLFADLWTKSKVFSTLGPAETFTAIPDVLDFRRSLNDGAVFGSFTGYVELFIAASFFALGFVFYLFAVGKPNHWAQQIALGMILAGALGNLYDRTTQVADIVTYTTPSGREITIIGRITSTPEDSFVRIGAFPEGSHEQVITNTKVYIRRQGVVRDFLKFVPVFPDWFPKLAGRDIWPWVFNVADASLVCGVILLLFGSSLERKLDPSSDSSDEIEESSPPP